MAFIPPVIASLAVSAAAKHDAPMADHPHTIDRWDDATGENLVEQIAGFGDYLALAMPVRRAGHHQA
jgi:hypothetical protein